MRPRISEAVKRNIDSITELEQEFLRQRSTVAFLSDRISEVAGSPFFVSGHLVWFGGWILINSLDCFGITHFDPYPFSFLGLCIAFEAALLSMFILMSQQRQTGQAEQWAHAGLQVGLLSEQESTKMLQMLEAISQHLGMKEGGHDREFNEMVKDVPIVVVMQELERALDANDETPKTPADHKRVAA